MKLKKALMAVAAICALAMATTGLAAAKTAKPVTAGIRASLSEKQQAIELAKSECPANCNYFGTKNGEKAYMVKLQNPDTLDYYDVMVSKADKKIHHITISGSNFPGSVTINKKEADVTAKILADYPDAKNIVVTLENDPNAVNLKIYKATFSTAKFNGVAQLNPATCLYGHRELDYTKAK